MCRCHGHADKFLMTRESLKSWGKSECDSLTRHLHVSENERAVLFDDGHAQVLRTIQSTGNAAVRWCGGNVTSMK